MSAPFYLVEDSAEREAGDLSLASRSLPVEFLPSKPERVRVKSKRVLNRLKSLLPGGVPRWVRCYDAGENGPCDRYTVVFCGRSFYGVFPYLAMNAAPFHPQGFGQHGETAGKPCDVNRWGFAPIIGRKCHLGRRIPFTALPPDCQRLVLQDYRELWGL